MLTARVRRVGDSVMVATPPVLLELSGMLPGSRVGMAVDDGRLVIEPRPRREYRLDELTEQHRASHRRSREEAEWLQGGAQGRELL